MGVALSLRICSNSKISKRNVQQEVTDKPGQGHLVQRYNHSESYSTLKKQVMQLSMASYFDKMETLLHVLHIVLCISDISVLLLVSFLTVDFFISQITHDCIPTNKNSDHKVKLPTDLSPSPLPRGSTH